MRIGIIAAARFPIAEPFAGGLEAHVWDLADRLRRQDHDVTLFAGPGSDPRLGVELLDLRRPALSDAARADVSMTAPEWLDEHHAYLQLMVRLARTAADDFDVIHNHSLHHLPIAMASTLPVPIVSTLHTPPTPWLESAIQVQDTCPVTFVAVSAHTAAAWSHLIPDAHVIHNGVDVHRWRPGSGGGPAVWFGRLVPEKGAHLAIDAAVLAGRELRLAGPISDRTYFEQEIRPRLTQPGIEYVGHRTQAQLAELVGDASVALVTPCWDEPYGLVVAEALACGTPVAAFARGALPELLDDACGRLVEPGDVRALAAAVDDAAQLSRAAARRHAVEECSLETMVGRYVELYGTLALTPV
ncbi:glycosyltransferase family 4 protein [Solirubrobacter phytolaccae]|uniref:Glycosyltransferase family 4 protein n=1 Tax=Solirubrobacter phytolaccae TaxID=1404360 RepID=A0A9X3NIK0_9ACTN|nr:glycosyltransferase family 4 protein [Solirubrobacter phytolaccae]MDA0185767.1 glycosyltransferase family 4 protein [Solirubrobacter phytolaccae]